MSLEQFPKRLNRDGSLWGANRIQDSYWKGGQHQMGKAYSEDLRERVVRAGLDGATIPETAERLAVSISSVVRFRRLHRETGGVSPAKFGGYKRFALVAHEELVRQLVAEQPDITLAEIKAVLATEKAAVGRRSPNFCII